MSKKKSVSQQTLKKQSEPNEIKNVLVPKKENSQLKHVLVTNGNTSLGDGLWCISKKEENNFKSQESEFISPLPMMAKIDKQTENSMISFLEKQLSDLGIELEQEKAKSQNNSLEKIQLKNNIELLTRKINELLAEIALEKNATKKIEEQMENIKELYNRSTRESAKISGDLRIEQEKNKKLTENLNNSVNKNDEILNDLRNEIKELHNRLEELEEENEDLRTKLNMNEDFVKKKEEEKNRHINEIKMQTVSQNEVRLEKLARVMQENAELSDKLLESESLRRKFMEKCSYQEKELKKIYEEKRELEISQSSLKKRINDLTVLKSSNNKIMEEKVAKLSQTVETITKENAILKSKLKSKPQVEVFEESSKETLEEVEAKPYLFGPYEKK